MRLDVLVDLPKIVDVPHARGGLVHEDTAHAPARDVVVDERIDGTERPRAVATVHVPKAVASVKKKKHDYTCEHRCVQTRADQNRKEHKVVHVSCA